MSALRIDIQSAIVMTIATASSLTVAWWLTHQEPRTAEAAVAIAPAYAPLVPDAVPGGSSHG